MTSTFAVGRVAKFARRWLPKILCCSTTHCGFLPKADDLLFVLSCCLANVICSFVPSEGRFSNNYGADQQRLQISDLQFDKFTTPATFAGWKIRFKTEVCICSQFPTEAIHWIKDVEMVDSVDDLKASCSIRGTLGPNFDLLDAKIASALNRIIHDTRFKRKVSLEEQKA